MSNINASTVKSSGGNDARREVRCDSEGRLEVVIAGQSTAGTTNSVVNISGTVTSGGNAQVIAAANANRIGYFIKNNSAGSLWINTLGTAAAAQPSLEIKPAEMYETPSTMRDTGAISLFGAVTNYSFTGREW